MSDLNIFGLILGGLAISTIFTFVLAAIIRWRLGEDEPIDEIRAERERNVR